MLLLYRYIEKPLAVTKLGGSDSHAPKKEKFKKKDGLSNC